METKKIGMIGTVLYRNRKAVTFCVILITFLVMALKFYTLGFRADDLVYNNQWQTSAPLTSIDDIINYQIKHYFLWGGRTVAHSILQLLFLIGKPVSSVINAFVFTMVCILITKIIRQNFSIRIFMIVTGLMFFINPIYEETILWYTGYANYFWTIGIILSAAYPFFDYLRDDKRTFGKLNIIFFPIAFLAGWCNENMSTSLTLFMFAVTFYKYKKTKKIDLYFMLFALLCLMGSCILILAPGNYVRASELGKSILSLLYRGYGQVNAIFNWLFPAIILNVVSFYLMFKEKIKPSKIAIGCIAWSVVADLAMILSPSYPQRATFGIFVLLLISLVQNNYLLICSKGNENDKLFTSMTSIIIWGAFIMVMISITAVDFARMIGINIPG